MCTISGFFNARGIEAIGKWRFKKITLILGDDSPKTQEEKLAFLIEDSPFDFRPYTVQLDEIKATRFVCNFIQEGKIYFFTHKDAFIHSKLYFLFDGDNPNIKTHAIIGSSNLTAAGLGVNGDFSNKELNLLCTDDRDKAAAKHYFDALFKECDEITEKIKDAFHESYFYHSPQDVLNKIASYFQEETPLDEREKRSLEEVAEKLELYAFQKIAAQSISRLLKNYHIALLADPVGSGKTLVALCVACCYSNVVIIAPPKLKAQWESYFDEGEKFAKLRSVPSVRVFSYHEAQNAQNLNQSDIKRANLIVLDESHNFRNKNQRYDKLKAQLSEKSDLLLLSATPINNSHLDLAHQLNLKNEILIHNEKVFPEKICWEAYKDAQENKKVFSEDYYKLCGLIFSRHAKDIERLLKEEEQKNAKKPLPQQKIARYSLNSIPPNIDFNFKELLDILGVNEDSKDYIQFVIYDPFKDSYLPQDIIEELEDKRLKNLGTYSTPRGFLCMKLIKALESSTDAFLDILKKIKGYHEDYLKTERLIERKEEEEEEEEKNFPERLAKILKKGYQTHLNASFKAEVRADLKRINRILKRMEGYNSARDFQKSEKFEKIKNIIAGLGENIKTQKLLVFTESIKTADALFNALQNTFPHLEIATITGNTGKNEFSENKKRFSPRSNQYSFELEKKNEKEIDILVATDCISEGQNLQDCANLINWDIAFNPVRAIQRIGRIWRINSQHKENHIHHFFPNVDFETYIGLESKLKFKLKAAASATESNDPFWEEQYETHRQKRKEQFNKMQKEGAPAFEDEGNTPSNLQSLFATITPNDLEKKKYKDGIFSILQTPSLGHNLLFAFLEKKNTKEKYFCRYEMDSQKLCPSATPSDRYKNLDEILPAAQTREKCHEAFQNLESLTADYQDLEVLKRIFEDLTTQLDGQIKENQRLQFENAKSNAPLIRKEKRIFKLLAWLLINPDFEKSFEKTEGAQ